MYNIFMTVRFKVNYINDHFFCCFLNQKLEFRLKNIDCIFVLFRIFKTFNRDVSLVFPIICILCRILFFLKVIIG